MAVLNVSALLASRGFRVLIIDFDLEAPGLSHLHDRDEDEAGDKITAKKKPSIRRPDPGVVELLFDAKERGPEADLFAKPFADIAGTYTFHYEIPKKLKRHKGASLSIMPSGRIDEGYSRRLAALDLAGLYEQGLGKPLIHHFKRILADSGLYDYIVVDSRTGHSDEAGICTRDLADHLMVVTGFNRQNISGTASFLANLRATLTAERRKSKLKPDVILSPVPIGEEDRLYEREKCASREFKEKWGESLKLDLFIPYHPRLALTEEAYVSTSTAGYLGAAYQQIEERLLTSLGHQPNALFNRIREAIQTGNGRQAVVSFQRFVKLRRSFISASPSPRMRGNWHHMFPIGQDEELLKRLLKLPEAPEILSLYAEAHPSPYELIQIGRKLHEQESSLAGKFDVLILNREIRDSDLLRNYAGFLENNRKDYDAAESFYKLSVKIASDHATSLAAYACFLDDIRKTPDIADVFYKRAIEADPKNGSILGRYAIFLNKVRKNPDAAEVFFKRAVEADPSGGPVLGNYAIFLNEVRKNPDAAEMLYKRAIEADPQNPSNLGNYGQILIGSGRIADGLKTLRQAWNFLNDRMSGNAAECCYSLWLGSLLLEAEENAWESAFKFQIEKGFPRHTWNFDTILIHAKTKLTPTIYTYAEALAAAFLDETKVAALEKYARWRKIEPVNPSVLTSEGNITEA